MLERCTRFIRAHGAVTGIQLAHAGRKASSQIPWKGTGALTPEQGGWTPIIAPSAIAFREGDPVPEALDAAGIRATIDAFAEATRRSLAAGFEVIEIHAAHGYLIHEFMSPLSNSRNDEYGGSFENRTRLLMEIVDVTRSIMPEELPLFVRISATDWADGGWDIEQSVELARHLLPRGVDLIDCSSGGLVPGTRIPIGPAYQTPFAERIRRETGMRTGAVGLITEAGQADAIVREGRADIVLLARQMLRDPYFALHAGRELGADVHWPDQYLRAKN